jgi:hypothetical protein
LFASPNNIRVIKPRRIRWVGHTERTGEMRMHTKFLLEKVKGRDHMEETGVDERIKLEWIFEGQVRKLWTGLIWLRTGPSGEFL